MGLMFNFNYTWSHMLDESGFLGLGLASKAPRPTRAPTSPWRTTVASNFDIRHMFKGHVVYDLPFGNGRQFVNTSKALDEVIGGWKLFGDFMIKRGSPFTPYMATNNSYSLSSNNLWYPNVVGNSDGRRRGTEHQLMVQRQRVCRSHSRDLRQYGAQHLCTDQD